MKVKVEDIKVDDRVDLKSCPYLHDHSSAEYEYAIVSAIEKETPECIAISYEGIDTIGYPIGTELEVRP